MTFTFVVLAVTILLLVSGRLRPDLVALMSLLALFLGGIVDTQQALAGFADTTVILIAVLFVVGEGIYRSGFAAWVGQRMVQVAGSSPNRLLVLVMVATAALSAFISNTGTVAMMIPVVVAAAWGMKSLPSKFLMPVAIAGNIAGLLTLISTASNIIVSDALAGAGLSPFGFFDFTLLGLPLLILTIVYTLFFGKRLLPERQPSKRPIDLAATLGELSAAYSLEGNLFWLHVLPGSDLVGQTLGQAHVIQDYEVVVLRIGQAGDGEAHSILPRIRQGLKQLRSLESPPPLPVPDLLIEADDMLLVKGDPARVERLAMEHNLGIEPIGALDGPDADALLTRELGLAEVITAPRSQYLGRTVRKGQISERFNLQVMGISRRNRPVDQKIVRLEPGDTLLARGTWEAIGALRTEAQDFVVVGYPEAIAEQIVQVGPQAILAIAITVGMVVLMLTGWIPTVMAALLAAVALVLFGVLTMPQAYRSINWTVVVLIAALLPMSTALQETGGVEFLANGLVNTVGRLGPLALMVGVFLLASGMTQVISNVATAVLLSPIALQAALELGVAPHPIMMMVALGVLTGFITPIGTPLMLMVMNPGDYEMGDYARLGLPLVIIIFLVSLFLVPLIWPL
jgi:di/tricarboxylate transporter